MKSREKKKLSHYSAAGQVSMVDVGGKQPTDAPLRRGHLSR